MLGSHVLPDGKIRFLYHHEGPRQVAVAGSFSDWEPVPLAPRGDGWWGLDIGPLQPGNVFYKFVTADGWEFDQFNYRRAQDGGSSMIAVASGCGHVLHRGFFSPALGTGKNYCVYLPPSYAAEPWRTYPVLYLMGGLFEEETGWIDRAQIEDKLDHLKGTGQIEEYIVCMPQKDEAVFDPARWDAYFHFLVADLPGHIESEYRTTPLRAIEGLSIGGNWAVRVGLSAPERYCSAAALSGNFDHSFYDLASGNADRVRAEVVRFRFACGTEEGQVIPNNAGFHESLQRLGISSEFHVNEGPHRWSLWERQIVHSLRFHDYSFKQRAAR